MSAIPILYSFRRCPYAMRARLALAYSEIKLELREIVLRDKPEAMLAASPKGTVPVLILPTGEVLDESLDIFLWALGNTVFSPDIAAVVAQIDTVFKPKLDRYKYYARGDYDTGDTSAEEFRDAALVELQLLDKALANYPDEVEAGQYLAWATLPFIRQFRGVDESWFDALMFSTLHARLQAFLASNLFQRIMPKFSPWTPDASPTIITF